MVSFLRLFIVYTVISIGLAGADRAAAQEVTFFRIGTGSTSGIYFPIGGLIASAISNPPGSRACDRGGSCGVPGLIAVAQATHGSVDNVKAMAKDPIVFAMANPDPEIFPEDAGPHVKVMATGRSDYPNQINNSLCFPGFFRGLLDSRAREVNSEMKLAAAKAVAAAVPADQLNEEYLMPNALDPSVAMAVAKAVVAAAERTGVARRAHSRVYGVEELVR